MSRRLRRILASPALLPALAAACWLGAAGCRQRPPQPAPDVAARIGASEIRYSEFQVYLSQSVGDADTVVASDVLSQLFDQFLDERLLLRLARDRGLVPAGATSRQAIDALLHAAGGAPPPEGEIAAWYQAHAQDYARPERVRLRQILTEDRRSAQQALAALQRGEDFAAVARRLSHDAGAAAGGYQGELARSDLPPAFVDAIFSLRPGQVSQILPAEYGFHLFQVLEKLPAEVVPLAAAHDQIADRLRRVRADRTVASLVQDARGRYNAKVYERNLPFEYEGSYRENRRSQPTSKETSEHLSAPPASPPRPPG